LDSLRDELRQLLMGLAPLPDGFDGKANLYSELGMSSLKAIELLMTLEERYLVTVPDEEFIECTSLERLAEMMQRLKS
jgi:acyl carrier protein